MVFDLRRGVPMSGGIWLSRFLALGVMAFLLALGGAEAGTTQSQNPGSEAPPHLSAAGRAGYEDYLAAPDHKAFAIAPGGAWAYVSEMPDAPSARREALAECRGYTEQNCVLFSVDGRRVFDTKRWPTLWRPYPDRATAERARVGVRRGDRFPDLAFRDAKGVRLSVSHFRGRILFLHFWASWCGHCQRELPQILRLAEALADEPRVAFVLLQMREPFARSLAWAKRHGIATTLFFDSGAKDFTDRDLHRRDGGTLPGRDIAETLPTTYVIGKHGTVIFSLSGPAAAWAAYAPFLRDAAARQK